MRIQIGENFWLKHPLDKPARWKWHPWFAWYPIQLVEDPHGCADGAPWVWLEYVERKMFGGTNWEGDNWGYGYRARRQEDSA